MEVRSIKAAAGNHHTVIFRVVRLISMEGEDAFGVSAAEGD
jgi:hypothetical protein